jgi:hypothetical protein
VECEDDPAITPDKPEAGFDTIRGTVAGNLDKFPGSYTAVYAFQDRGTKPTGEDAGYYHITVTGTDEVIPDE